MFDVRSNIADLERDLSDAARRELPRGVAWALTDTAKSVEKENRRRLPRIFDRPTRWTINAWRVKFATARDLKAQVLRKTAVGRRFYLEEQEEGGTRPYTAMEKALRYRLPYEGRVGYVAPTRRAPLDASGNLSRGTLQKIFSQTKSQMDARNNESAASRKKRKRKGGATFFVPRPNQLSPGVYRRQGRSLRKVLHFDIKVPTYKPRLRFHERANKVADKLLPKHLSRTLDKAMKRRASGR